MKGLKTDTRAEASGTTTIPALWHPGGRVWRSFCQGEGSILGRDGLRVKQVKKAPQMSS